MMFFDVIFEEQSIAVYIHTPKNIPIFSFPRFPASNQMMCDCSLAGIL